MFSKIKFVDVIDHGNNWLKVKRNQHSSKYLEDECTYIIEKYSPSAYGDYEISGDIATISFY